VTAGEVRLILLPVNTRERMEDMRGADCSRFPEILDELEEALAAQEKLQEISQPQAVAGGVRGVLLDSRASLKLFPRLLSRPTRREKANG
jgi:hypothetical protein